MLEHLHSLSSTLTASSGNAGATINDLFCQPSKVFLCQYCPPHYSASPPCTTLCRCWSAPPCTETGSSWTPIWRCYLSQDTEVRKAPPPKSNIRVTYCLGKGSKKKLLFSWNFPWAGGGENPHLSKLIIFLKTKIVGVKNLETLQNSLKHEN